MGLKEEFIKIAKDNIKRDGIDDLLSFLETTDFYEAPASTKYHGSYAGGLLEHSINVYYALLDEIRFIWGSSVEDFKYNMETLTIVSLFHDLCKIGRYRKTTKNFKNKETGVWEEKEVYEYDPNCYLLGHGAKSLKYIHQFMRLTDEEEQAIYWHMGPYDLSDYSSKSDLGHVYTDNTLAFALNRADMFVTYIIENDKFEQ